MVATPPKRVCKRADGGLFGEEYSNRRPGLVGLVKFKLGYRALKLAYKGIKFPFSYLKILFASSDIKYEIKRTIHISDK